jgi:hypothetical protein
MNVKKLLTQNPTNDDLRYIIRWTDKKDEAWEKLRQSIGVEAIDEDKMIKEIAEIVLKNPGKLRQDNWHCKTAHCIAGWLCVLNGTAADVERRFDTPTAGFALLPKYSHLFYNTNNEEVIEELVIISQ